MTSKWASTMTTRTSTDERLTSGDPPSEPLPDVATLARWANEFFAAIPGEAAGVAPPRSATDVSSAPVPAVGAPQPAPLAAQVSHELPHELPRLAAHDLKIPEVLVDIPRVAPEWRGSLGQSIPQQSDPLFYFVPSVPLAVPAAARSPLDVRTIRRDFPILETRVHGRPLVWLDNAATTQKPTVVIERLSHFYRHENSNVHRAAHELAARATDAYEGARREVQRFLGAASPDEIVFVRGATEAINLVAQSWGRSHLSRGDEIIISHLEHHANIVPWYRLAQECGAALKVIPVDSTGQICLDALQRLISARTRMVAIAHVSNALGTITPVREVVEIAHRAGALALIDGAQSVSHMPIDVQAIGADFFALSGHKVFGPTGIGVLYGRAQILEDMPPWQGGGNMIEDVTFERIRYQHPPTRFEAGTGNIADAAGLGAALEYISAIGMQNIERYEAQLLAYATEGLSSVPKLHILGQAAHKASVLSFWIDGIDPEAIGSALNQEGIAVRAGHHCAQPILRRYGRESTVRASLAFYNTAEEIDALVAVLKRIAASGAA